MLVRKAASGEALMCLDDIAIKPRASTDASGGFMLTALHLASHLGHARMLFKASSRLSVGTYS